MILSYIHLDGWWATLTSWLILKETEPKGRHHRKQIFQPLKDNF